MVQCDATAEGFKSQFKEIGGGGGGGLLMAAITRPKLAEGII